MRRWFHYAAAVEVDLAGGHAHGARGEHRVEEQVALEAVEQEAEQSLGAELWIGRGEPLLRVFALAFEEFGDGVAGGEAVLERGVDAAGGDGRDHAGRIADEECPFGGDGSHDSAAGDRAGADRRWFVTADVGDGRDLFEKLFHDAFHRFGIARHAAGQADLRDADAGDHPTDVAGGEFAVEEAVEAIGGGRA